MNMEKRQHERFTVEDENIQAKMIFSLPAELFNVSTAGACIKTTKILKLSGHYLIRFKDENLHLPLRSTVMWEILTGSIKNTIGEIIPVYKSGIKFNNINPDKIIMLKDFIRASGILDEIRAIHKQEQSPLRYKIHSNEKALLNYSNTFNVRDISLGGILVESNNGIQPEKKYIMALFLPDENDPIKFQGRIVSRTEKHDNKSHLFNIGIEFLNIKETDSSRLSKFLSSR